MADLIRDSIADAGPRPITPYYGDVSTSVQRTWHPPEGVTTPSTPEETDNYMSRRAQRGRACCDRPADDHRRRRRRRARSAMSTSNRGPNRRAAPADEGEGHLTERARHERRLGLTLSAPAFIVMILVTAYPLVYAVVLSLYKYRLTDPEGATSSG